MSNEITSNYKPDFNADIAIEILGYKSAGVYDVRRYDTFDGIEVTKNFSLKASEAKVTVLVTKLDEVNLGDAVRIYVRDVSLFEGFVDEISVEYVKPDISSFRYGLTVSAYDVLKNMQENYEIDKYDDLTSSEVAKRLCERNGVPVGEITDTSAKVEVVLPDGNQRSLDILSWHLAETFQVTGINYVAYTHEGKLYLKDLKDMVVSMPVTQYTCASVSVAWHLKDMKNAVILRRKNHRRAQPSEMAVAQDSESIKRYGKRTFYKEVRGQMETSLQDTANKLLNFMNKPRREISVRGQAGDPNIRGGSVIPVILPDLTNGETFMVAQAQHIISGGAYTMNLELFGGDTGSLPK